MQRRSFLLALAGSAATLATAGLSSAQASLPWLYMGSRKVNPFYDHDTIATGAWKVFRKLKINVAGNSVYMYDLKVTYHDGSVQHIPTRWHIPQGGGTRILDLTGNNRIVRKVEFKYGKLINGKGRTIVNLYGQV